VNFIQGLVYLAFYASLFQSELFSSLYPITHPILMSYATDFLFLPLTSLPSYRPFRFGFAKVETIFILTNYLKLFFSNPSQPFYQLSRVITPQTAFIPSNLSMNFAFAAAKVPNYSIRTRPQMKKNQGYRYQHNSILYLSVSYPTIKIHITFA
jgi:hypothetical protein